MARGGVQCNKPSENQHFDKGCPDELRRGGVELEKPEREFAFRMQKNGKTEARINILAWDGSMNCDRGAALNGKTQARIHILIWD